MCAHIVSNIHYITGHHNNEPLVTLNFELLLTITIVVNILCVDERKFLPLISQQIELYYAVENNFLPKRNERLSVIYK